MINEVATAYQIPSFTIFGEWAVQKAWENVGKRAAQSMAIASQQSSTPVPEEDLEGKETADQGDNSLEGETEAGLNEPLKNDEP